ncbi:MULTISPECIES: histidine phosphatase family protein [unclassified Isoptericola]|uniref:histidine phosphatase family protein n=1 Tax=unclassified Isoptericola TaxID=2623355 RepID=UPI0036581201
MRRSLFVVAHPHAEHTAAGLVGGWYDSRLTDRGRADAHRVAAELSRRLDARPEPGRPVRVTTSDLARAAEAADVVGAALGVAAERDRRLREISFGDAEGRPNAWLDARRVHAPDDDRLDHRGPVPGAETRREVAERVGACVAGLMADEAHDHVVVTHGFAHTFVVTTWLRVPVEAAGFATFATSPGAITHLAHDDGWRNRTLVELAATSHLASAD